MIGRRLPRPPAGTGCGAQPHIALALSLRMASPAPAAVQNRVQPSSMCDGSRRNSHTLSHSRVFSLVACERCETPVAGQARRSCHLAHYILIRRGADRPIEPHIVLLGHPATLGHGLPMPCPVDPPHVNDARHEQTAYFLTYSLYSSRFAFALHRLYRSMHCATGPCPVSDIHTRADDAASLQVHLSVVQVLMSVWIKLGTTSLRLREDEHH